jgi:hypothetical protein
VEEIGKEAHKKFISSYMSLMFFLKTVKTEDITRKKSGQILYLKRDSGPA